MNGLRKRGRQPVGHLGVQRVRRGFRRCPTRPQARNHSAAFSCQSNDANAPVVIRREDLDEAVLGHQRNRLCSGWLGDARGLRDFGDRALPSVKQRPNHGRVPRAVPQAGFGVTAFYRPIEKLEQVPELCAESLVHGTGIYND